MIGTWIVRCGMRAVIDAEAGELIFGWIYLGSYLGDNDKIPSYWCKNGNSICHDFDLVEKIKGPEFFSVRGG
jgi:hypothetical protein